ncbi:MAG: undecaprenyldiphospho-muramoylpentapeptide beta-N-acetylglucosaminyltransferase [Verrucomicrobiaceae bacterium]|nr:undecaprenyldiphospho-muramoylpentapeptide beta-N-acetylglucosaminyltransferase [Verrucomicrobiaceae bacterium]
MSDTTVLIMAGGTGGHVFPALAVADVLLRKGARVQWLGTARGIEADLVPKAGIPLHVISVAGLRGKGLRAQLLAPFQLARALWQALQLLKQLNPDCVLGLGGFASGPGGLAAWLLRKPLIIHEQNAIPGTTNRLLSFIAKRVLLGYPHAIENEKAEFVGNPVRAVISQLPAPEQRWVERTGRMRLLVLGGSLGAQPINALVPAAIAALPENLRPEIIHQTGRKHNDGVGENYRALNIDARVDAFIDDMAAAYAWADVVLCRSGALTVAELAAAGVGAILVPLPHAIDDHQTHNARWLSEQSAGVLLPQAEFNVESLTKLLRDLSAQPQELLAWARNARALAKPEAASSVADICLDSIAPRAEVAHV